MIVFTNPGLIDTDAAFTMGVNVKEGSNPIGHFGTGLKFALATLLRNDGKITIWRGTERIDITGKPKDIRGKQFNMVCANNEQLGFTTELGKGWEPWMAFRELACNALDENGRYYSTMGQVEPEAETTHIVVQGGGIDKAYHERGGILAEGEPIYADERFEVRPGETNFIYYRGVRVGKMPMRMTHHYNILQPIELTEDRTYKWEFEITGALGRAFAKCDHKEILDRALKCGEGYVEHHISIPSHETHSEKFKEVAATLREDMGNTVAANPSAKDIARTHKLAQLGPDDSIELSPEDQQKLNLAIQALKAAGYPVDEYPVTLVNDLGPGVYGMAKEERIFMSRIPFEKGTKEVAATLLEEWAHMRTGYGDMTRGLQTWLFDQVLCQVEARNGKPF